jgi:hypothetical protein
VDLVARPLVVFFFAGLPVLFVAFFAGRLVAFLAARPVFAEAFFGTLPPAARASDNPIATACFRLVTFLPLLPLRNFPSFISCIARFTFDWDFFPYFAIVLPF